jgi:hypothetical protein
MSASRILRALSILWISPIPCFAQSEPPSNPAAFAWGRVPLSEADRPIRHARVDFVSSATGLGESTLTDDKGQFQFEGLPPANYSCVPTSNWTS